MSGISTGRAAVALVAFAAMSVVVVLTIAATIAPFGSDGPTRTYRAEVTSASRLSSGDDVRVAGVRSGRVLEVSVTPRATALVTFEVDETLALSTATQVQVRYLNLVGDRYLALVDDGETLQVQPADEVIGTERTRPALDLDALLGGFKPLFAALSPEDVDALALDIVRTLQGDGGTVRSLIARTASLTTGLAERDELIGDVVGGLDATVGQVADRQADLAGLVGSLRAFVSGLAEDREAIGSSLASIEEMTRLTAGTLERTRPDLKADIGHLREVAATIASPEGREVVEHTLDVFPRKLETMIRTASYGPWFNYYVCSVGLRVDVAAPIDPVVRSILERLRLVDTAPRCEG